MFPDYTKKNAQSQLRRIPSRMPKKLQEVKDELDPYANEARAYHRIDVLYTSFQRIYFPEFHGVITDLDVSKFSCGYVNRRAVVLEPTGDVRDDHFRLPGDFHDRVLYDFSVSYTFSPVTPYLINFRLPRSLKDISGSEQTLVRKQIFERAGKLEFRDYLVKPTGVTQSAVVDALFQPLEDEPLELIILRCITLLFVTAFDKLQGS